MKMHLYVPGSFKAEQDSAFRDRVGDIVTCYIWSSGRAFMNYQRHNCCVERAACDIRKYESERYSLSRSITLAK